MSEKKDSSVERVSWADNQRMVRPYGTHLYLLCDGECGLCKIGRSMDVARRVGELKRGNPWAQIRLVAVFPDQGCVESWVMRALSAHERRGEWFRCSVAQAMAAIGACLP